jgi:hypothetical protein
MPTRKASSNRAKRSFYCRACDRRVRMPAGWSAGSAGRRHYWAKHPEIMRGDKGASR